MRKQVGEQLLVSPVLVLFLVHSSQLGVGVLGFESDISAIAGYDAWISVIITGLLILVVVYLMYGILRKGNGDFVRIHKDIFGKWLGGTLSFLLACYFLLLTISATRYYIQVIQIWMFPELPTWLFSSALLFLAYYFVSGGFRVITGIAFFSVVYSTFLAAFKITAFTDGHISNLTPIYEHSTKEIIGAVKPMIYSFLGPELLLAYYPFIKNKERSLKWAQFGVLATLAVYSISAIAIFMFFNQEQLKHVVWPTLNLWKMVDLPVIERFEFVGITIQFIVILPNICIPLWAASRGFSRVLPFPKRPVTLVLVVASIISCYLLQGSMIIERFNSYIGTIGSSIILIYIPILFIIQRIWLGVKNRHDSD